MGKLQGKTAIITGATGGIGAATAKVFLREGANVMLVGRSAEKLKETFTQLGPRQGLAQYVADATDEVATAASVEATVKTFGGVDILFANAGTEGLLKPVETRARSQFAVAKTFVAWTLRCVPRRCSRSPARSPVRLRPHPTRTGRHW